MKNEIINSEEFGIDQSKANELIGNLPNIKQEREALIESYDRIITLDLDNEETSKQARELRLKIRDNRTKGIEIWHKTTKDFFLKGGQFVDAIKNKEIAVNKRMEENLEQIEKHAEIKEKQRIESVRKQRIETIEVYKDFIPFGLDLGIMTEKDFERLFKGAKLQHEEEQKEKLRIEEETRQAEIKAKAEEDERKRLAEVERLQNEKIIEEARKKEVELQKQIQEEKNKAEKLAKEIQERKQIEDAEKLRIQNEKEKLSKAPKKEQLNIWIDKFFISTPDGLEGDPDVLNIVGKFVNFKAWAKNEVSKI